MSSSGRRTACMFKPRQVESLMLVVRGGVPEVTSSTTANESSNWAKDMAANIKNKLKGQRTAHRSAAQHRA